MNYKQVFRAMFRALDCLYDEKPNKELQEYLSNANPYVFKDRESADPEIIKEFHENISQKSNDSNIDAVLAYSLVQSYLLSKTQFAERFSDISLEEWVELCKIIEAEDKQ